jgi:hypothetical protein
MPQDDPLLLNYGFSTDPIPVAISTQQVTNQARVNVGVNARAGKVYCNRILVAVPLDSLGPNPIWGLFAQPPAGSVNTRKWAITSRVKKGRELGRGLPADEEYATFTYDCISGKDQLIDYNLVFGLFGSVSGRTGEVEVLVQETSGTGTDPATFTDRVGSFPVRKEWPQFYLKNLAATTPNSPTVPTTDFRNGAPVRVAWESNGSYFQLFVKDQTTPIYSGTATTCTLTGGVSRDTTFILAASMTGSPGQDTPQGGYQPIYLYDSLTITVANPVLTPTSVDIAGTLGVTGTSRLGITNTGALTSASATVTGSLQAGDVSTNGALTGTGSASLANLTVTGLTGTGGRVSLFGRGVRLWQGASINMTEVRALTDGFAMAYIHAFGSKRCFARVGLSTGGTSFYAQGGTILKNPGSGERIPNPNSLLVPVQAGSTWSYGALNEADNEANANIEVWWYPIGSDGRQAFQQPSPGEAPSVPDFDAIFVQREQ